MINRQATHIKRKFAFPQPLNGLSIEENLTSGKLLIPYEKALSEDRLNQDPRVDSNREASG